MKKVVILGSTGTLGSQVLEVLSSLNGYVVKGVTGWSNQILLNKQKEQVKCDIWGRQNNNSLNDFLKSIGEIDVIVNCIGGMEGILASWISIFHAPTLFQGNKESLFLDGKSFLRNAKLMKVKVIPLDSELSTLWYLNAEKENSKLKIFASGGVIKRGKPDEDIQPFRILQHPVWNMGKKITIDSTSFVNKIMEVGAASTFFCKELTDIEVFIDRTGNHHAGVELGNNILLGTYKPTMKTPIFQLFNQNGKFICVKKVDRMDFERPIGIDYPLWSKVKLIIENRKIRKKIIHSSLILGERVICESISFKEMTKIMVEMVDNG